MWRREALTEEGDPHPTEDGKPVENVTEGRKVEPETTQEMVEKEEEEYEENTVTESKALNTTDGAEEVCTSGCL
ncbi:hypothetical protein E2C01_089546 [Portunus trituberculatus]|uniref:Uncharacterized protein n=1 Tax=Portunus trituberculatus TaxID=210409 RepID=A0A5B7JHI9_PORTR|nr:hypothetical protein [Portunus trituberculatus]